MKVKDVLCVVGQAQHSGDWFEMAVVGAVVSEMKERYGPKVARVSAKGNHFQ